jgi:histidinol-phosphatase (PHP family)
VRWWADAGGDAVSFGSDAHRPGDLASGFAAAAEVASGCGFRAGSDPAELWGRTCQGRSGVSQKPDQM